ncbi:MAG: selenoprotein B glycine/betaine/sarcosine/D-proline reductase [Alphaproteobacteria bacterium]|nr:selenoprotein B glycine/betaine/sarcosine/D-proline reductase [Alphaproteobacteria bacterium]
MVLRLSELDPAEAKHLGAITCPTFTGRPFVPPKPLDRRRIAIVSTAGLQLRGERGFAHGDGDYRVIPGDARAADILMSHVSVNFDRTGFQQDINVVFPIDRMKELAAAGVIGGLADFHYSFMGAMEPQAAEPAARALARLLHQDAVDTVLLVPV